MQSQYRSPFSIGKRKTVYIDAADPRVQGFKANITAARLGAELVIVDSRVNTLSQAGRLSNIRLSSKTQKDGVLNPKSENFAKPGSIANLSAEWQDLNTDGATLLINFDFDFGQAENQFVDRFVYRLTKLDNSFTTIDIESKELNKTSSAQTIKFTEILNINNFAEFQVDFAKLEVASADSFGNVGDFSILTDIPEYQNTLPTPVITVTSLLRGYSVDWQTVPNQFEFISIEEVVSNASTAPTSGYEQVYLDVKSIKPAKVITPTSESRWVRARFNNKGTLFSAYSNVEKVTPQSLSADFEPPNEVTIDNVYWSGDNIVIEYTLPSTDPGVRFLVELTDPDSSVGSFYLFPTLPGNSQVGTIYKRNLETQFLDLATSYAGVFKSIDAVNNISAGVSFNVPVKTCSLTGVTPTAAVVPIPNGYTVGFVLPSGASYGEVYHKATSWGSITHPKDYYTSSYSSGGASGTNTVVVNNVYDEHGSSMSTIPTGYFITGVGIPINTFVSAVSGSNTLTLTLSTYDLSGNVIPANLTQQASGTYTLRALVYSGPGPATIPLALYGNQYVVVKYFDDWGCSSNISTEVIVEPINPAIVDNTAPSAPAVSSSSSTNNTIDLSISTTDETTKGYRLRYKKSTDTLYQTDIVAPISAFSGGTSTTSYTLKDLIPNTTYNISAAGYNQFNGVGAYSTDINVSTSTPTVSVVTNLQISALTYSLLTTWTAAPDTPTKIAKYKVELYNSSNTLLETQFTFSTNASFSGLSASTTYYVKVYAQDIYDNLGAAVTSSNLTLNAAGGTSNGSAPTISPTPTVTSLYQALEIKWTALTFSESPDLVTYEVHISTTSGFTPSSSTKSLETKGTFAIIKTLPGTSTSLTYGQTYYVKIIAKDIDGSAAASTQASAQTLQVDNGDLATDSVRANVIKSGTITATQIDADNLLVGKLFAVGAGSGDTSPIKIDASGNVTKLYSGTGIYTNSNTPFYLDTTGKLSLKDRLSFDGNATLTVRGVIEAQSGKFDGAMTIGTSPQMKIGSSVNGSLNGIYIDSNNYWYTNGNFAIGANNNRVSWDGTSLNVTGELSALRGSFAGPILMGSNGYILLGTSATITNVSGNGTTVTYTANNSFTVGQTVTITGVVPGVYNLTNATIASRTSTQFTVTNSSTGTYQYGGLAIMTNFGKRIQIDSGTISAYDAASTSPTTQIIGDSSSAYTFFTSNALIGGFTVDSTKLQAQSGSSYVGFSTSGTYSIYAGAENGGSNPEFGVTPAGLMQANNVRITGGNLDIGSGLSTTITVSGSGTSGQSTVSVGSASGIVNGMRVFGTGISSGAYVTGVSGTTITLSASNTATVPGPIRFVPESGAHITASGDFYAENGNLSGNITAKSGRIEGNLIVIPAGSIIAGPGTSNANSIILKGSDGSNDGGLAAFNSSGSALTEILTRPITFGSTPRGQDTGATSLSPLPVAINFFTSAALIGGWVVGPTTFSSRDQQFVIDSTNTTNEIRIYGSSSGTNYALKIGRPSSTFSPIIWAGPIIGGTPGTANFSVSQEGNLTALNANLQGKLTTDSSGTAMVFGKSAGGSGNDGIYIDANDYWYKDGSASFGSGNIQILSGGTVKFATGNIEFNNVGDFLSDENNYAGDPTITLNTSNKLTQGRRFIYNGTANPTSVTQPGSIAGWNGTLGTGKFYYKNVVSPTPDLKDCKVGDLIFTT